MVHRAVNPLMLVIFASLIAVVGTALAAPPAPPEPAPQWKTLAPMPAGVFDAAASKSGGRAVVTGGIEFNGQTSGKIQILDIEKNTWSQELRLTTGRAMHAQVTLNDGRILVAGGKSGSALGQMKALNSMEVIDIANGKVEAGPPLPETMAEPTAHVLADGRVVIIGGGMASVFNPLSMKWQQHISLRESRESHASVLLSDGRILIAGGINRSTLELVSISDPPRLGASQLVAAKLSIPLDDLAMVELADGRAMILGGQNSRTGNTTDETWIVDPRPRKAPVTGPAPGPGSERTTIEAGPSLGIPGGVADHCAVRLGKWIFIIGGETEQNKIDHELNVGRAINTEAWATHALSSLAEAHDDAVMIALEHSLIVVGGYHLQDGALPLPTASKQVERLDISPEQVR